MDSIAQTVKAPNALAEKVASLSINLEAQLNSLEMIAELFSHCADVLENSDTPKATIANLLYLGEMNCRYMQGDLLRTLHPVYNENSDLNTNSEAK